MIKYGANIDYSNSNTEKNMNLLFDLKYFGIAQNHDGVLQQMNLYALPVIKELYNSPLSPNIIVLTHYGHLFKDNPHIQTWTDDTELAYSRVEKAGNHRVIVFDPLKSFEFLGKGMHIVPAWLKSIGITKRTNTDLFPYIYGLEGRKVCQVFFDLQDEELEDALIKIYPDSKRWRGYKNKKLASSIAKAADLVISDEDGCAHLLNENAVVLWKQKKYWKWGYNQHTNLWIDNCSTPMCEGKFLKRINLNWECPCDYSCLKYNRKNLIEKIKEISDGLLQMPKGKVFQNERGKEGSVLETKKGDVEVEVWFDY